MNENLEKKAEELNSQTDNPEITEDFDPDQAAEEVEKKKKELQEESEGDETIAEKEITKEELRKEYISLLKELVGDSGYDYREWAKKYTQPIYYREKTSLVYLDTGKEYEDLEPDLQKEWAEMLLINEILMSKQDLDDLPAFIERRKKKEHSYYEKYEKLKAEKKAYEKTRSFKIKKMLKIEDKKWTELDREMDQALTNMRRIMLDRDDIEKSIRGRYVGAIYRYSRPDFEDKEKNIDAILSYSIKPDDETLELHAKAFYTEERKEKIKKANEILRKLRGSPVSELPDYA